ncbi:MAG: hypothetical protein Q7L55_06695 [Actinomycetota bacterium]|nr:hypothetical protein [Actinomycetota bacterium]
MKASAGFRRFLRGVVVVVITLMLAGLTTSPATADSGRTLALGDSVMLGARAALQNLGVQKVDAKVSRQATTAPGLLRERGDGLQRRIVIHLGTNGIFSKQICRSIMKAVGPDRQVFLVNFKVPRRWEKPNNRAVDQCAALHADQVTVVDWHLAASKHPGWLYSDGMHLRPSGARGFAKLIEAALRSNVSDPTFVATKPN